MKWSIIYSLIIWVGIASLAIILTGCAEFGAKLVTNASNDYDYFRDAGANYVDEVIEDRKYVRAQCRMSLQMRVSALQQAGDWSAVDKLLSDRYSPLVTQSMWESRNDPDSSLLNHVATPWICGKVEEE